MSLDYSPLLMGPWVHGSMGQWGNAECGNAEMGQSGSARGSREDSESSSAGARASGGGAPRALIEEAMWHGRQLRWYT
jgi:hypothetical protein